MLVSLIVIVSSTKGCICVYMPKHLTICALKTRSSVDKSLLKLELFSGRSTTSTKTEQCLISEETAKFFLHVLTK